MSIEDINKKIPSSQGKGQILLENRTAIWADSTPSPTIDVNNRKGWYYTNTNTGDKANIYFFGGNQETILIHQIRSMWAKISIDNNSSTNVRPFFIIYTKPQASGNAGAFYHSRFTYTFNNDVQIGIGEEVIIHTLSTPDIDFDNRFISMPNVTIEGDGDPLEEVLYMTIHTDSGATPASVKLLFSNLGFQSKIGHIRNIELIGYVNDVPEYPTNASGILLTASDHITSQVQQIDIIANNSTFYSGSVSNTYPSKGNITIFGNSGTQNTDIKVQYSEDDSTWYFASNNYISFDSGNNGDFAIDFKTQSPYIRVSQFNNHGTDVSITVKMFIK